MIDAFPKPTETAKTMPKFKVSVSRIELHCPIGELAPTIFNTYEAKLSKQVAKLWFRRYQINCLAIPPGITNFPSPVLFPIDTPCRVFIGLQSTKIYNGEYQTSFMTFQRHYSKITSKITIFKYITVLTF